MPAVAVFDLEIGHPVVLRDGAESKFADHWTVVAVAVFVGFAVVVVVVLLLLACELQVSKMVELERYYVWSLGVLVSKLKLLLLLLFLD